MSSLLALSSSVLLATFVLLIRKGISEGAGTPAEAVVIVLVVAALLHGVSGLVIYFPHYAVGARSLLAFITAGVAGSVLGKRFFLETVARLGAATADSLKASTPGFSFLWAVGFLREPAPWYAVAGVCGGLVLIARRGSLSNAARTRQIHRVDILIPLVAALFYSLEPICARIGLTQGTPPPLGLAVQSISAAFFYLVYAATFRKIPSALHRSKGFVWFFAAGVASAGFLFLYNHALSFSSVIRVFPITQVSPLLVIAFSWAFLRSVERIRPRLVLGATLVSCGAAAVSL